MIFHLFQNIAGHLGPKNETALLEGGGGVCISLMWTEPGELYMSTHLYKFIYIHIYIQRKLSIYTYIVSSCSKTKRRIQTK